MAQCQSSNTHFRAASTRTSRKTESRRIHAVLPLLAANLMAVEAPRPDSKLNLECPNGVLQQLDGLYRWQVQRMDQADGPSPALASQRDRFTPGLFTLLLEASQLSLTEHGRYLDFDVFSNTQVRTFGAMVSGCSAVNGSSIQAAVDVQAGLRQQASAAPSRQLIYNLKLNCKGQWQINEITYRNERVFQLRPYLEALVNPTP